MDQKADDSGGVLPTPIRRRYLLVIHIPVYCDYTGVRWLDRLWAKDLFEHLVYIENLTLACPCFHVPPPSDFVRIESHLVRFCDLPAPQNKLESIMLLPATVQRLWRSIGNADLVHSGLGGWFPLSLGNLTMLITKLRQRFLFIVVESAPWRLPPGSRPSRLRRVMAFLAEIMNRWCIDQVDLAVFTQAKYKESLLVRRPQRGHVIHASWIDRAHIASDQQVRAEWEAKLGEGLSATRFLFAGRLTASKGVAVLLQALEILERQGIAVRLDIIGEGELFEVCRGFGMVERRYVSVKTMKPIPYGLEFFRLIGKYHAIIVPSITDEQPRIVYDAYGQGVPVLASDTDGLRDCIKDGITGRLCRVNDPEALGSVMKWAAVNAEALMRMGIESLKCARGMTHQEMHQKRWRLLARALES